MGRVAELCDECWRFERRKGSSGSADEDESTVISPAPKDVQIDRRGPCREIRVEQAIDVACPGVEDGDVHSSEAFVGGCSQVLDVFRRRDVGTDSDDLRACGLYRLDGEIQPLGSSGSEDLGRASASATESSVREADGHGGGPTRAPTQNRGSTATGRPSSSGVPGRIGASATPTGARPSTRRAASRLQPGSSCHGPVRSRCTTG